MVVPTSSLWGTLNSFFGGSGLHWDRSYGGQIYGILNPIWVDTSTPASGYSVSGSNTYTIVAEGQDTLGDEGPPLTIATTTMVFPFLSGSGSSSTAAVAPVFSEANGIESAAVGYWTVGSSAGEYNFVLQDVTDNLNNLATGAPSLSLSGSPVTLESNVALTPGSDDWTFTNNSTNFVLAYSEGNTVNLQAFSTTGTPTTTLTSMSYAETYEIVVDASGIFHWITTSGGTITEETYNATTGAFGAPQSITTDLTTITQSATRYSSNNDGSYIVGLEGTNSGGANILEYDVYNSSGTQLGTHQITLNSTALVHVDVRDLQYNGEYAVVYDDATTPGGSTFDTYMMVVDANGTLLAGPTQIGNGSLGNFDRIRGLGNGLVEIDYRSGTTGNELAYIYDTRTAGTTITGTSGDDLLAGTTGTSSVSALGGNDIIAPAIGTTTIDGGTGFNSVEYNTASSNFTLTQNGDGSWSATASYSSDGFTDTYSDTLTNVEVVHFNDKSIAIRTRTADDFSQSGTSDILYRSDSTGDTGIYAISNGANTGWHDIGASSTAYTAVATGDFLGNGTPDILYRDIATGDTGFYAISNAVNTGWHDVGATSTAYSVVGIGDFYGNGTDEILFRDNSTGDTGFYAMVNGVNNSWVDAGASSTAYSVVGVGDFTGGGTDDILYRDNSTGDTGFYEIVNGVKTGWVDIGASSTAYSVVGVGDFFGNGTADILYRDNSTGDTGFYEIVNGVKTGWVDIGASSTAYSVVATGDYLGTGTSDVMFRDNTTGDTGFYAISNGANTGWHDIGASSTAYHVVS
jgi:hypothetical protein